MRLSDRERNAIVSAVHHYDVEAQIFLFGSRVDDAKKGEISTSLCGRYPSGRWKEGKIAGQSATPSESKRSTSSSPPILSVPWHGWRKTRQSFSVTADILAVLRENPSGMQKSAVWLRRSYTKCTRIGVKENYTEDEFDSFKQRHSAPVTSGAGRT